MLIAAAASIFLLLLIFVMLNEILSQISGSLMLWFSHE